MKQHIIIFIYCLAAYPLKAQLLPEKIEVDEMYSYIIEKKDNSNKDFLKDSYDVSNCDIYFYKNLGNIYSLIFTVSYTNDRLHEEVFSYGTYVEKDNQIILTDAIHHYQMHLIRKKNMLCFTKGLTWLNNRCFELSQDTDNKRWSNPKYLIDVNKARLINKEKYPKTLPISTGIYKEEKYCLNLLSNHKYNLYFNNIEIMNGVWSTENGELLLHTNMGKAIFYLRITNKGLISQLLPGDNKGVILKKVR